MDGKDNVELRSEKMRHIIGEIPPKLIRLGTAITVAVCILIGACLWFVKINGERLFSLIFKI